MPIMFKNIIVIVSAVLMLVAGLYFIQKSAPSYLQALELKSKLKNLTLAPDFELSELNGQKIKLSNLRGKRVILIFWSTWNEDSIKQLKNLDDYSKFPAAKDMVVLAINSLEEKAAAEKIKTKEKIGLTVLLDQEGAVGESYELGVLPLTVIIDKGGLLEKRIAGPAVIQ